MSIGIVPFFVNLPVGTYEALDAFCRRERVCKAKIVRAAVEKEIGRLEQKARRKRLGLTRVGDIILTVMSELESKRKERQT